MVANAPTETREEALTDRQFFNQALLAFTEKPKLDGRGGWLHPNMATSLFHYQVKIPIYTSVLLQLTF